LALLCSARQFFRCHACKISPLGVQRGPFTCDHDPLWFMQPSAPTTIGILWLPLSMGCNTFLSLSTTEKFPFLPRRVGLGWIGSHVLCWTCMLTSFGQEKRCQTASALLLRVIALSWPYSCLDNARQGGPRHWACSSVDVFVRSGRFHRDSEDDLNRHRV
jgi:hypothetical protein